MEKININDIDFSTLQKSKNQGTKSILYENGDFCIKILNSLYDKEKKELYRKFLEMDGISINGVILPKTLIVLNDKLEGYIMDNFKNSTNLIDYFGCNRYVNCKDIFKAVKKTSLILKSIHENGIICQDLSFDNILIDINGNIKYCDIDGCTYKDFTSPFLSLLLKRFLFDYRKENDCCISKNMDRISLMLSFYLIVYTNEIQKISKKKYDMLSNNIVTLENMKKYAKALVNKKISLHEIPYLDELIDDNDDYIIDREKQLSLTQKILRKF